MRDDDAYACEANVFEDGKPAHLFDQTLSAERPST